MKHILIGVLALFSLMGAVFFLEQQQAYALPTNVPQLRLDLLGPYGQHLFTNATQFNPSLSGGGTSVKTTINLNYYQKRYTRNPDAKNSDFCGEGGGDYYIRTYLLTRKDSGIDADYGFLSNPVFHCLTSKELMEKIKMPNNWQDDTLSLYCSDTGKTPGDLADDNNDSLSSFLFSSMDSGQVGCLLKNEDKVQNSTLFYGFPYGNVQLEEDRNPFYNKSNESIPLLESNNYELVSNFNVENPITLPSIVTGGLPIPMSSTTQDVMQYNSTNIQDDSIYISYINNSNDPYFVISRSNRTIQESFLHFNETINQNKIKDDTSRTLLIRKFQNRTIYGYQSQESLVGRYNLNWTDRKQNPIYVIHYEGFGGIKQTCIDSLSAYNPEESFQDIGQTTVVCKENDIFLQSRNLNKASKTNIDIENQDLGFSIFKNSILGVSGKGESLGTAPTEADSILDAVRKDK